jgi:hypothetical protein
MSEAKKIPDDYLNRCPECGIALIIDAPLNVVTQWQEILETFEFQRVAVVGGWERCGLENSVPLDGCDLEECEAAYLGDLVTPDLVCPRCQHPVQFN